MWLTETDEAVMFFFLLSDSFVESRMGCDGGTIPTRDELVKLKKKPEQKDADAVRLLKWAHCALSQQVCAPSAPPSIL